MSNKEKLDYLKLFRYFCKCLDAKYIKVDGEGDYAVEREGNTLYLIFQWSRGEEDWKNNFDFPAKPYKDMGTTWYCHRGFLRAWKNIEDHVQPYISDESVKEIIIIGYSHGAAIATLAHEYVWFNRPDLRDNLTGYGFGCPRCFYGRMKKDLKERWATFYPIRNLNDIVTHLPPRLFGFSHTNTVLEIGTDLKITPRILDCINAHYADNYIYSLKTVNK